MCTKRLFEDTAKRQSFMYKIEESLARNQSGWHLDLELLASKTVRKYKSVVLAKRQKKIQEYEIQRVE